MTEIVKRLRHQQTPPLYGRRYLHAEELMAEAADTIERLQAEVARLEKALIDRQDDWAVMLNVHKRYQKEAEQRADALAQRIANCPLANCGCRENEE